MSNNKPSPPTHQPKGNPPLKADAAIKFLASRGVRISRRTLYNWLKVGVGGIRLEHGTVPNTQPTAKDRAVIVVTAPQLEEFLSRTGVLMA